MSDNSNCPNIEACPMFQYFKRYAKEVYQELYCKSDYQTCERYKRKKAGEPVPKNLLPHGVMLWEDEHWD